MSLIRTFPNTNPSVEKGTYDMEYAGFSVPDTLRDGARAIACELLPKHPLELVLCPDLATAQQDAMTRQIYGLHYPLRMAMERSIVSQVSEPHLIRLNAMSTTRFCHATASSHMMLILDASTAIHAKLSCAQRHCR